MTQIWYVFIAVQTFVVNWKVQLCCFVPCGRNVETSNLEGRKFVGVVSLSNLTNITALSSCVVGVEEAHHSFHALHTT